MKDDKNQVDPKGLIEWKIEDWIEVMNRDTLR
jgi:hypothetical protein